MENVLEVVQAAGWEVSHWRVMLSGNDGSRVRVQVELMEWAAWMDVEGHGFAD